MFAVFSDVRRGVSVFGAWRTLGVRKKKGRRSSASGGQDVTRDLEAEEIENKFLNGSQSFEYCRRNFWFWIRNDCNLIGRAQP